MTHVNRAFSDADGGRHNRSRRTFIARSVTGVLGLAFTKPLAFTARNTRRPSIYWTADEAPGLQSVVAVRASIKSGARTVNYEKIRASLQSGLASGPILPSTPVPGRGAATIANANPDFYVVNAAAQRILQSAFVTVVENEPEHAAPALEQLDCLFDPDCWPPWIDQAHVRFGHPVDLRTGMLAEAIGLAFDWLYPYLTPKRRSWIVEGLDRRALQPFNVAIGQGPWWLRDKNNWMTTIVGGMGIAGMALRDEHPESTKMVQMAVDLMESYLTIYGPEGEFNESVNYANATVRPVALFLAHRYWSDGSQNRLAGHPFPETCRWVQYLTLPPGRVIGFGDSHPDRPPWTSYIAAVAAATRNPVLQWFHETYGAEESNPVTLLWWDPSLESLSPADGEWPLGELFPAHGGCLVARTDWSPKAARCIVYGKSGREENHEHNDVGQLCIDAFGERLIIDPGSPSGYPADFFDEGRYEYYNASIRGHNVLMFDGKEMRSPVRDRGEPIGNQAVNFSGKILGAAFDDAKGSMWTIDCSPAYSDVERVTRTVVFLTPGVIVALDEAVLPFDQEVSLRWHTAVACRPDAVGRFSFETARCRLVSQCVSLAGDTTFGAGRHGYKAPYDRSRDGDLLEQRREPYVEVLSRTHRFALATLFYVGSVETKPEWEKQGDTWLIEAPDVTARVTIDDQWMRVTDVGNHRDWEIPRETPRD